jgi:hypothetical protein
MKLKSSLGLLLFVLAFTINGHAQEPTSAAESVERLKLQLLEVQAKEEDLRVRAQQLDESLKPENIERSLAGVGSTKPEELREFRRRQLTIERDSVAAQLKLLETSRSRLETAISNAEALAYQQSARPATQMLSASARTYELLLLGGTGLAALALGGGAVFYKRRRRAR